MKGMILLLSLLVISTGADAKTHKKDTDGKKNAETVQTRKAEDSLKNAFLKSDLTDLMGIAHYPVKNNEFTEDRLFHHDIDLKDALNRYLARFTEVTREFNEKAKNDKKMRRSDFKEWNAACFKKVKLEKVEGEGGQRYKAVCKPMEFDFQMMDGDIYFTGILNFQ